MALKQPAPKPRTMIIFALSSIALMVSCALFLLFSQASDLTCLFPDSSLFTAPSLHTQRYTRPPHETAPNVPILRKPRCVVYDRPPRTGSTTVASALARCFHKHGFHVAKFPSRRIRHLHVPLVLSRLDRDFALVAHHFWLSDSDVALLHARCNHTFYMTSAAPLHERLWSAAKVMSTTSRNGNFSLQAAGRLAALDWLRVHGRPYAPYLEAYPFIDLLGAQLVGPTDHGAVTELPNTWAPGVVPKGFRYDFVFRKTHLQDDLTQVLALLNCSVSYDVKNVHEDDDGVDKERDDLLFNISKDADGALYKSLMTHAAKANHLGLLKLKHIVAYT